MLFDRFKRTIDRYHLLEKGDRVIVGVSAGVDSMVLLHLLTACREIFDLSLVVAHVNHGFRPEESEREAELVQKETARLRLPFEYGQFNVKEFQRLGRLSPQDAARRLRFRFFEDLLLKHHAQKIALGHNADDQVETVLIRLFRGSGLRGLKGILPIRERKVMRPLLDVWREEIASFALEKKIPFLRDSSNLKEDYLRNSIRLTLIPFIEKTYQPRFKETVLRTSALLREEDDYLEKGTEKAYQKVVHETNDSLSFKWSEYQSLHRAIQWRVIRKMIERIHQGGGVTEDGGSADILKVFQNLRQPPSSFLLELPRGLWVEKRYDAVLVGRRERKSLPPFEIDLLSPGRTFIEEIGKEVVIEETDRDQLRDYSGPLRTALMDYETLRFPLKMRNFRPGDRFCPLGVRGTQKLKDFFIDHKVPKFERSSIPLLTSGEKIAWVVGYRIDERVKITEKTKKVLKIEVG
jgi:tRNA(Ile)-lysidine synthase